MGRIPSRRVNHNSSTNQPTQPQPHPTDCALNPFPSLGPFVLISVQNLHGLSRLLSGLSFEGTSAVATFFLRAARLEITVLDPAGQVYFGPLAHVNAVEGSDLIFGGPIRAEPVGWTADSLCLLLCQAQTQMSSSRSDSAEVVYRSHPGWFWFGLIFLGKRRMSDCPCFWARFSSFFFARTPLISARRF